MGLSKRQLLWRVEVPLAMPVIIAGLRIATVSAIALITIASLIGRGGFGQFILEGLNTFFWTPLLVGVVLSVALAFVADIAAAHRAAVRHAVGEGSGTSGGCDMNGLLDGLQWLFDGANWSGVDGIPARVWEHVQLSAISLVIATMIAMPLGLWIGHSRRGQFWTVQLANVGRSIPSLAVLSIAFLLVLKLVPDDSAQLAFGFLPTIVALTLLGIPVILINTYVGIQQVDPDTVEAAKGMGMDGRQVLARLEIPMAMPLIMTGLRLAAVQIVATAGLAALIAGGALGRYIVDGFALRENDKIVGGSILIACSVSAHGPRVHAAHEGDSASPDFGGITSAAFAAGRRGTPCRLLSRLTFRFLA